MVETRIAPRHRVMKAGTIEFGSSAIDCVLRNLSITGTASVTLRHHAEGPPLPRREQWARQGRSLESLTPRPGIREQYLPIPDMGAHGAAGLPTIFAASPTVTT